MEYEWDEAKRLANLKKHKVDFYAVYDFEWSTAFIKPSSGHIEPRLVALGYWKERLYQVVYVIRVKKRRIISFRIANPRERREYAEQ